MRPDVPITNEWGDGPPALFIHGLGGFKEAWGGLPRAAAAAGLHAVAVDLPGAVGAPTAAGCDAVAHAVALAPLLDRLGSGVGLVGHSLGAQVALRLARARPGLVRRLVLIAPVVAPRPPTLRLPRGPAELLLVPALGRPLARLAIAAARRDPARRRAAFLGVVGARREPPPDSPEGRLVQEAADRLARADLRCFTEWAADGLRRGALRSAACAIAPTLVVAGARDPLVSRADLARLMATLPDAHALVLAGAGHFPHLEGAPATTAAVVAHLLRDGPASSGT